MKQQQRWMGKWQEYMDYMEKYGKRPSKYKYCDKHLVNWLKYNRKRRNKGLLPPDRCALLDRLYAVAEKLKQEKTAENATPTA